MQPKWMSLEFFLRLPFKKITFISAIILIIILYITLLLIFRNPKVSIEYSMYYIEKELKYWPTLGGLKYSDERCIYFNKTVPYLSRHGWDYYGDNGTWTDGKIAKIYLFITKNDELISKKNFFLSIWGNLMPVKMGSQKIDVILNGNLIGELAENNYRNGYWLINFHGNLLKYYNINIIQFIILNPTSPKSLNLGDNPKNLGLFVKAAYLGTHWKDCITTQEASPHTRQLKR